MAAVQDLLEAVAAMVDKVGLVMVAEHSNAASGAVHLTETRKAEQMISVHRGAKP